MTFNKPFDERGLLRLPQVLTIVPVSRSTWYAGMKSGRFPAALRIGGSSFWRASEVLELVKGKGVEK